ncbi:MAG: hypothetical protein HY220_01445 [Candidatus Sungbacteria bacterium]|uniref:R3H domain-containing protein n=1 Tax=Candidatus Sungiibacteriota bacterium TaxID=2750080 RepID=A0A9D6LRI9_9BACT|nr:hypothetical protein [Candidatus Sungbacteria bacterium]
MAPADLQEMETNVCREIEKFLELTKIPGRVTPEESMHFGLRFNIEVPDARFLIGEHGANLASLEYLVKKIVQKKFPDGPNFSLDVNDYKLRHAEMLRDEVKMIAKKVRMYRKEIILKPMSSYERRIIHMSLAEYPDIITESVGENPDRRVVIKPNPL